MNGALTVSCLTQILVSPPQRFLHDHILGANNIPLFNRRSKHNLSTFERFVKIKRLGRVNANPFIIPVIMILCQKIARNNNIYPLLRSLKHAWLGSLKYNLPASLATVRFVSDIFWGLKYTPSLRLRCRDIKIDYNAVAILKIIQNQFYRGMSVNKSYV